MCIRDRLTEMQRLERKIGETKVHSPADGVVSTPRLQEKLGRKLGAGETLAWIDRLETLKATVYVDEKEIGYVRRGQKVQFRVSAYPDRNFDGTVQEVATRPTPYNGKTAYEVRLRVRNPQGDLKPGITGYAKLISGDRPVREVLLRKLHRYVRTEVWTWY